MLDFCASRQRPFRGFPSRLRWHFNHRIRHFLPFLDLGRARVTIQDGFGSPGDTLLMATFARNLKKRWPRLNLNAITPNPDLIAHDPVFSSINGRETYWAVLFTYLDLLSTKRADIQVLQGPCNFVGLEHWEYRAKVPLLAQEQEIAKSRIEGLKRPIISINAASREKVKTWPFEHWKTLVEKIDPGISLIQLGDSREPDLPRVLSFAGKLTKRESMALLAEVDCHVGPDSFLMHAANGVDTPAVILFGSSRLPSNLGYAENENLTINLPCSSCWIHDSQGQVCPNGIRCMQMISPEMVIAAIDRQLLKGRLARS